MGDVEEEVVRESLKLRILATAALAILLGGCAGPRTQTEAVPPPAPREFRAAWVASVANIDWPSRAGLPAAAQQEEIVRIVERAQAIGLNALIVQVRPAADALYASPLEPWSEYLTGRQGVAPEPWYDPLAFWIAEAHRRGIELHAWFNPYRARHPTARSPLAASHIANTAPELVKSYGDYLWLDPAEHEAAKRTLDVIVDVVRRYDVDGIHIDDYFYPYPINAADGVTEIDFPDDSSWAQYRLSGGNLARADWRRANVDALVKRVHTAVHREKPSVRFGVSPFGVGRPDLRPAGVTGFSQYDKLYANVELWLARGWLDYLAPQLYWAIDSPGQPFGALLDYWTAANTAGRHVWPGYFTSRIDATEKSWSAQEIVGQVIVTRERGVEGHIHFSMAALLENRKGVADELKAAYQVPALVPESPWLLDRPPAIPTVRARTAPNDPDAIMLEIEPARTWLLAVWTRHGAAWRFQVVPGARHSERIDARFDGVPIDALVVSAVNRVGQESPRIVVRLPDGKDAR